jgi:hypothetical protein
MTKKQYRGAEAIARDRANGYEHGKHLEEDAKSENTQYRRKIRSGQDNVLDLYITYDLNFNV